MNITFPLRILGAALAIAALFLPPAHAQNATTVPVGVVNTTLNATTQIVTTYYAIPLSGQPVFAGKVFQITGNNTFTVNGTSFTANQYAQAGQPHYVRFVSGQQAGRTILILSNTANQITVDTTDNSSQSTSLSASGFAVAAGDRFQIIPGDTLASFFGDNSPQNPLILVGASSAFLADTVGIYNKSTSKFESYFFSTTLGYWRTSASTTNSNSVPLHPDSGIVITRRAGRPALSISVLGEVPTTPLLNKTTGSNQVIHTSTRLPVNISLAQLNLSNWTKSNSAFTADTLSIFNPVSSKFEAYYQRTDGTWRKSGDVLTDQGATLIPTGTMVTILKRASVSGSASFISCQLPYNLD